MLPALPWPATRAWRVWAGEGRGCGQFSADCSPYPDARALIFLAYYLQMMLGLSFAKSKHALRCCMRFAASPTLPSPLSIVVAVAGDAVGWF